MAQSNTIRSPEFLVQRIPLQQITKLQLSKITTNCNSGITEMVI